MWQAPEWPVTSHKSMKKKIISMLLSAAIALSLIPSAYASVGGIRALSPQTTTYPAGAQVVIDENIVDENDTITFVPLWKETYDVKYAVSIYGINADVDQSGNPIGLTFGPATGANYVNSSKYCEGTSESAPGDCMHWMTWDQIILIARTTPERFENCLENGCTHSVMLNLPDKIRGTSYDGRMSGDGASILYNCITSNFRKWNNTNYNYGGWPASRMRATLNGPDEYTADGTVDTTAYPEIYYNGHTDQAGTDMEEFTAEDTLLSAFPKVLRDAIVPKKVVSDTYYSNYTSITYTATTYDKLWLFACSEVYQDGGSNNSNLRPNEGAPYSRTVHMGISTKSPDYAGNKGYNEGGSTDRWWLRSARRGNNSRVYGVGSGGDWSNYGASGTSSGLAPGFCV